MEGSKKLEEVHRAYRMCREVFEPSFELMSICSEITDPEEYDFYKMVHEHFLQKGQKELIEKGVY